VATVDPQSPRHVMAGIDPAIQAWPYLRMEEGVAVS
jgi:hypothetical protein